ncbi:MAG: hypothetical protein RR140_04020 [Clostridia bacterium]
MKKLKKSSLIGGNFSLIIGSRKRSVTNCDFGGFYVPPVTLFSATRTSAIVTDCYNSTFKVTRWETHFILVIQVAF